MTAYQKHQKWTPEHVAILRANAGRTTDEMADALRPFRPRVTSNLASWACARFGVAFRARGPTSTGWPPEHVEALRALEGNTAAHIAKQMRRLRPGVTRNAVIAQCSRRGIRLSGASNEQRAPSVPGCEPKRGAPAPKAARAPKQKPLEHKVGKYGPIHPANPIPPNHGRPEAWAALPGVAPVALLARTASQCAWPVGDAPARPAEQLFCGAQCDDDTLPYCAAHRRLRLARRAPADLAEAEKIAA